MDRATEQVNRIFQARRDRRDVLRMGIGVTGAAAVAALSGFSPAMAQDAGTPVPTFGMEDKVMYLFVQAFHDGTWTEGAEAGTYTVTLHGGLASTIYFSDRPERIYGASPTQTFLDNIGFSATNPPNAALVVNSDGVADIIVVELFDPVYDEAGQTLTYTAKVLEAYHETGLEYLAVQQEDDSLPPEFGAGALFIDDCPDQPGWCQTADGKGVPGTYGNYGLCFTYPSCYPCRDYGKECDRNYPDICQGKCTWVAEDFPVNPDPTG